MLAKLYLLQMVAYELGISLARALEIRFSFFLVVNSKTISYKSFVVKYYRHFNEVSVASLYTAFLYFPLNIYVGDKFFKKRLKLQLKALLYKCHELYSIVTLSLSLF